MKELKKKAVIGTTLGLASLIITAAGCAYGPPPDMGNYEVSYSTEAVSEEAASSLDSEIENTLNEEAEDSASRDIFKDMNAAPTVYGPPNESN